MIPVVVTTFPRKIPTVTTTLRSLTAAGFCNSTVSRGRGNPRRDWLQAAKIGLRAAPKAKYILVAQDDILVSRGIYDLLLQTEFPKEVGCLSLYCPDKYLEVAESPAFPAPDENTWGACALLFPSAVLQKICNYPGPFLNYPGEKDIDSSVGKLLKFLELQFWYLFPSAVQHVGESSTLCDEPAAGWRQSSSFPGEESPCRWNGLWQLQPATANPKR